MKKLHSFALYALVTPVITFGAGPLLAQQPAGQDTDRQQQSTQRDQDARQSSSWTAESDQSGIQNRGYLDSAPANGLQASNLIGAEVKTTGDEDVGAVSDLIIEEHGQVVAIVVGVGGFLGMGQKDVAIGWDDVKRSGTSDDLKLRVDLTREGLSSAPKFEAKQSTSKTAEIAQSTKRAMQSDSETAADRRNASDQSGMQNRGYLDSAPANGLQASNLIGAEVKTTGDEDVGPVSDLIIDDTGHVVAIVVGVGGFLGMGERNVAIGWDDVTRSGASDDLELQIDVTREGLRAAPEFEARQSSAITTQSDQRATKSDSQVALSGSQAAKSDSKTAKSYSQAEKSDSKTAKSYSQAEKSDSKSAADRRNASDQSRTQNRGYLDSAPANGLQASNLIGAKVKTTDDEEVGPVSDLIIDDTGHVVAIVVGVGGFLGMGERNVAIGWDDVTRSGASDDLELRIDATREGLRSAPEFDTQD